MAARCNGICLTGQQCRRRTKDGYCKTHYSQGIIERIGLPLEMLVMILNFLSIDPHTWLSLKLVSKSFYQIIEPFLDHCPIVPPYFTDDLFAESYYHLLKEVDFSRCNNITSVSIIQCSNLETLHVCVCWHSYLEKELLPICAQLPKLRRIYIHRNIMHSSDIKPSSRYEVIWVYCRQCWAETGQKPAGSKCTRCGRICSLVTNLCCRCSDKRRTLRNTRVYLDGRQYKKAGCRQMHYCSQCQE